MQMMTTRHHSRRRSAPRAGRWGTRLGRCLSLTATALVTAALLPVAAAKPAAAAPAGGSGGDPGSAELLQTLPGFKIERILKADPTKNGSWISMARDSKGRLLLGIRVCRHEILLSGGWGPRWYLITSLRTSGGRSDMARPDTTAGARF